MKLLQRRAAARMALPFPPAFCGGLIEARSTASCISASVIFPIPPRLLRGPH